MIRSSIAGLCLALAVACPAHADVAPEDSKAIDAKVAAFFGSIQKGETKTAYDNFMTPVMSEQQQAMRNLISLTDQVVTYFDGPFTYEMVQESELGKQLVFRKYVMLSEKAPYIVTMTMYRTSKGWVCQAVILRDMTQDDFPTQP